MRLEGKVAIVTGAASGIGLATARLFLAEGARVVAGDIAPAGLEQYEGPDAVALPVDVTRREDDERLVATALERFGRLDVVCNIAGVVDRFLPVDEVTDEIWERVLAVNLTGPMMLSRAALPRMLAQGSGVIVNVSSISGIRGGKAGAAYTSSKHGLIGLTRSIAAMYAFDGIRCLAVCPGGVETPLSGGGELSPRGVDLMKRGRSVNPRVGAAEEIASVMLFAASDDSSFVNGAVLVADAGWTAI